MKKILLISGHGAGDPGCMAKHDGVQYQESVETIALAKKVALALGAYDVEVEAYPYDHDAYKDYLAGTLTLPRADLLIELHFNAHQYDKGDGIRKGTLALLAPVAHPTAEKAAKMLCAAVSDVLTVPNRGVQPYNGSVIRIAGGRGIPALILEVCFLDDADDWERYYIRRDETAAAIAAAACEFLGVGKKPADAAAGCSPWAAEDCRWAVEKGLFKGDGNGNFRWTDAVTRQELAAVLRRFAEMK